MDFSIRVTTENPKAVLGKIQNHSEFDEVDAEQTDSDRAFAGPEAVEIIIEFLSEPENIKLVYSLLRELGHIVITVQFDDEVDPEKFILENTQTDENNLELVRQETQENPDEYEYRDSSRGVRYNITLPTSGEPKFEMRREDE